MVERRLALTETSLEEKPGQEKSVDRTREGSNIFRHTVNHPSQSVRRPRPVFDRCPGWISNPKRSGKQKAGGAADSWDERRDASPRAGQPAFIRG